MKVKYNGTLKTVARRVSVSARLKIITGELNIHSGRRVSCGVHLDADMSVHFRVTCGEWPLQIKVHDVIVIKFFIFISVWG